ncbi:MAG: 3'-5' exonuclease [Oscillospiraceae bacterium]|nr:3'-5' exonuclease [Oscillospiraceae bacterium]
MTINDSLNAVEKRVNSLKHVFFDKYYSFLNDRQREAVYSVKGRVLVLAGAGSGKTTALVNRIAYLINFGDAYYSNRNPEVSESELKMLEGIAASGITDMNMLFGILKPFADSPCPPHRILAITFTNKAAAEIKSRLDILVGEAAKDIWSGTFHSICVRILRRYIDQIGYNRDFSIYDTDDTKKLIVSCIKNLQLDDKVFVPREVQNKISYAKNRMISYEEFTTRSSSRDFKARGMAQIYELYQKRLKEANALDFDDIIMLTVILFRDHNEPREYIQNKFSYVLVDEYQDTNTVQCILLRIISEKCKNLMVVGDDDQSIYKFRGAVVENILGFDKEYPEAKIIMLEQNYRSTKSILEAANALIAHNESRHGKILWCDKETGDKILIKRLPDREQEAQFIADTIKTLVSSGKYKLSDFAVLYRVNAVSNELETVLTKNGIPHRLLSGTRFNDRAEIKDIHSYLAVIENPSDTVRLMRIINTPRRGIGDTAVNTALTVSEEEGITFYEVICNCDKYEKLKPLKNKFAPFCEIIEKMRLKKSIISLPELFRSVIEESGYMDMLIKLGKEAEDKIDNINELVSNAVSFTEKHEEPTLSAYLEESALISDIDNYDESSDSVVLMTVHSAKGLEFNYVFLPAVEEGIFPSQRSVDSPDEIEEERRLFYVALTRAKKNICITNCETRLLYGFISRNPVSRFASEIPDEYCDNKNVKVFRSCPEERNKDYECLDEGQRFENSKRTESSKIKGGSGGRASVNSQHDRLPDTKSPKINVNKAPKFDAGDIIEHKLFGIGEIVEATEVAGDMLYVIDFAKAGRKKLLGNYAQLKKSNI